MTGPEGETGWHARPAAELSGALATDRQAGLAAEEARRRLERFGGNVVAGSRPEKWWHELLESLTEPLVLLLIVVGIVYAFLGELEDALTIFSVILAVAAIEVITEARAKRSIASLRSLAAPGATVIRNGQPVEAPAADLVEGDLVLLSPGDRVPADVRLTDTAVLRVDESSLTGESVPVAKDAETVLPAGAGLGDRTNLAFAGTLVVGGKGQGIVVATGRRTELGHIATLAEETREPRTPLQVHLRQLGGQLTWVALAFSVLIPAVGVVVARRPLPEMVLTGLTLAFATIPEELPILITVVLGIGAYQLSRQQAVVKRLRAAETLGSVSLVGTDKTGTLTENRMRVATVRIPNVDPLLQPGEHQAGSRRLLEIGLLANDAHANSSDAGPSFVGDPTETALLAAAEAAGLQPAVIRATGRIVEEFPFDDVRKRMSVVFESEGGRRLLTKGAPEMVFSICAPLVKGERIEALTEESASEWLREAEAMAAQGLRVLAFAERRLPPDVPLARDALETQLTFVGFAGLEDPLRREVPAAIASLKSAGVRVVMLTGDHAATARVIAERAGLDIRRVVTGRELDGASDETLAELAQGGSVFARIAPEHKLRLVQVFQKQGEVVAVTGDGVNDAPALRQAAIGVAMGQKGTDAAREAADLVLADDNFATVALAIRAGRVLYANLRKAIRFYLAAKVALVTASLAAVVTQLPVPFEPVQIILMELFMDLGASTTFVAEQPERDVMAHPPRDPKQPFMDGSTQLRILGSGLSLGMAVLVSYWWAWRLGEVATAQTAAFVTWMIGHVVLAAHMRFEHDSIFGRRLVQNRPFLLWVSATLALLLAGMTLPFVQTRLHLAQLPAGSWEVALASALILPAWWEGTKAFRRARLA